MRTSSTWQRMLVVVGVLAALVLGLSPAAHADPLDGRRLLYRTHVDAAHIAWENDRLAIKVVDGATPVDPAKLFVRLGPDAIADGTEVSRLRVPADPSFGFLGKPGDIVWHAPQQLYPGHVPLWAGFGSGQFPAGVEDNVLPETLRLELVSHSGPGEVHVFSTLFGKGKVEFSTVGTNHRVVHFVPGAHGHFSWAFTKAGRHDLTWQAKAETRDGKRLQSAPTVVSWLVGTDAELGLPPGTTAGNEITKPVDGGPTDPSVPTPTASPTSSPTDEPSNPSTGIECDRVEGGKHTLTASWRDSGPANEYPVQPTFTFASAGGGEHKDWQTLVHVPSIAETKVGEHAVASVLGEGTQAWRLPATATDRLAAISLDATGIDFKPLLEARLSLDSVDGPGRVVITSGDSVVADSKGAGLQVLRLSATTRPLEFWFSQPGFYSVDLSTAVQRTQRMPDGEIAQNYEVKQLWFAVGDTSIKAACTGLADYPAGSSQPSAPAELDDPAEDAVDLAKGHVDAFFVEPTADGLRLNLREDITGRHVVRNPDRVTLRVLPEALTDIPAGYPGAPKGYLLPLAQNHSVLWPGWDTSSVRAAGLGAVSLEVADVQGPGEIHVFSEDTVGKVTPVLAHGRTALPGVIDVPEPTHAHAHWVFTKAGRYTFSVQAKAGDRVSEKRSYTWVVGEGASPSAQPTGSANASATGEPTRTSNPPEAAESQPVAPSGAPTATTAVTTAPAPGVSATAAAGSVSDAVGSAPGLPSTGSGAATGALLALGLACLAMGGVVTARRVHARA